MTCSRCGSPATRLHAVPRRGDPDEPGAALYELVCRGCLTSADARALHWRSLEDEPPRLQ